jgi:hypothetical protein
MLGTTTTPAASVNSGYRVLAQQDAQIRELTRQVIEQALPQWNELGKRHEPRVPYPRLVQLTPLDNNQLQPIEKPFHVVGKQLATQGFDFYHHEPIPYRYAVLTLDTGTERWIHFLMRINWCRFIKAGWYDSGGKFIKQIDWTS